jgi:hypothetical protein
MSTVNLYNIDTEAVEFLGQIWQLNEYSDVLALIDTQPAARQPISHWLVQVVSAGGDDITDVSQARELIRQYAS